MHIYIHGKTGGRDIILAERFQGQVIWGVADVPVVPYLSTSWYVPPQRKLIGSQ